MKKLLLKPMAVLMALLLLQLQTKAGTSVLTNTTNDAIINFNESEIYFSFDQIYDLVSYISENNCVTYADLESENNPMVENISATAALVLNSQNNDKEPPFMSSFMWGCAFGVTGVLIVYATTDSNKLYTKEAWKGCAVSAGCQVLIYVAVYAIYFYAYYMSY